MYFDDCEYEQPHVASQMNTLDAAASVLDEDGKGGYRFDRMALPGPFDILGFFLGYMSGPIIAESAEERKLATVTSWSYRKKTVQKEELRST